MTGDLYAAWRSLAACNGRDPMFDKYIAGESFSGRQRRMVDAAVLCLRCPVAGDCLADVDLATDSGIRAGNIITVGRDGPRLEPVREWLRKQRPIKTARPNRKQRPTRLLPREHGTERGYYQHRDRDDWPACEPCLQARTVKRVAS